MEHKRGASKKPPIVIEKLEMWKPKFKRGDTFSCSIFASRRSGKSYLIRHLIRKYLRSKYDLFVVVSDSPDTQSDLSPVLPDTAIFLNEMDYSLIDMMGAKNDERVKQGKKELTMLVVFDDKIGNEVKSDDKLLQIFTRGRHIGVSIIFSSQSKKFAETTWITNSDYIIMLKANVQQQRKTILDNIIKGTVNVPDEVNEERYLRLLMSTYMSKTGDALVVDNKDATSNNLRWYRAP